MDCFFKNNIFKDVIMNWNTVSTESKSNYKNSFYDLTYITDVDIFHNFEKLIYISYFSFFLQALNILKMARFLDIHKKKDEMYDLYVLFNLH